MAFAGLGGCSFPALETLAIELAHESAPAKHDGIVAALRGLGAPALSTLEIAGGDVAPFLRTRSAGRVVTRGHRTRYTHTRADQEDYSPAPYGASMGPARRGLAEERQERR